MVDAIKASNVDSALNVYKEKVSPLSPKALDKLVKLVELQLSVAKRDYDASVSHGATLRALSIGALIFGFIFAAAFGMYVARGILHQLGGEPADVLAVTRAITAGDLTTRIDVTPGYQNSVMAGMQTMQQSLRTVVASVRQGSESVATASAEIASGNHDLSTRTEQQASSLEETASQHGATWHDRKSQCRKCTTSQSIGYECIHCRCTWRCRGSPSGRYHEGHQ